MLQNIETIIVRMPNWIGDLVMATPILADLRAAYPHAHITAMCRRPNAELLEGNPYIDELFYFTKPSGIRRRLHHRSVIEKLRKGKYDLGVLLTNSFSSAWWFWQGHVKQRLGYRGHWRKWWLTCPVAFPSQEQHLVVTYKMLLEPLGIGVSKTLPTLFLSEGEILAAKKRLALYGIPKDAKIVGIHPGAAYGQAKCWLPERFKEVIGGLSLLENVYCVCFGDHSTHELISHICEGMPPQVINLASSTTLRELASMISLCTVFLTNDSGPMHIADALGVKTLALFGSTNPQITGPYRQKEVIYKKVSCSPCYQRTCPTDFACMKEISAEEVFSWIKRAL